jgi:hypothetical protein
MISGISLICYSRLLEVLTLHYFVPDLGGVNFLPVTNCCLLVPSLAHLTTCFETWVIMGFRSTSK